MTYYLFERDLTSDHVSYHYCFLDYQKVSFPSKSKIEKEYETIYNILTDKIDGVRGMRTFHKAITPCNKFIESPYFHLSLNGINEQEYQLINDTFGLNTNYRYSYFTKLMSDIGNKTDFKCGFLFGEFNNPINASYAPTDQVDDYLRLAGGLNEASNTKMIIISPDGTTQTFTPSFLKLSRPVIYPGTIIYSGKDVGRLDGLQFSATLAPILSSLAISLASLNSINN